MIPLERTVSLFKKGLQIWCIYLGVGEGGIQKGYVFSEIGIQKVKELDSKFKTF